MARKANNKEILMAAIEAKYDAKIKRTLRRYRERTMEDLWKALDKLKAKMRQELEDNGLNDVKLVSKEEKILTNEDIVKQGEK